MMDLFHIEQESLKSALFLYGIVVVVVHSKFVLNFLSLYSLGLILKWKIFTEKMYLIWDVFCILFNFFILLYFNKSEMASVSNLHVYFMYIVTLKYTTLYYFAMNQNPGKLLFNSLITFMRPKWKVFYA